MEHLLAAWPKVAEQLKNARHILLFVDYDGTLTPIVDRPELADLSEDTRQLLKTLARERRCTVGIISGRALPDLKNKVKIDGIIYAGNHGLEIEGPGLSLVNPLAEEIKPVLRVLYQVLRRALGAVKGVLVEDKGLTLSVHYRQVATREVPQVQSIFQRMVGGVQALGKVRISRGKKVLEVRPAVAWDKGKAIRLLMKRYGKGKQTKLLPVYLGDDLTDEDGFGVIAAYENGISVFVGEASHNTTAQYYLRSPREVTTFLGLLLEHARGASR